jgi:hypothetical protein
MARMWKMTLKQRRRHGELMASLDRLKRDKYLHPPKGYQFGGNPEEDAKYEKILTSLQSLLDEMHQLEAAARNAE